MTLSGSFALLRQTCLSPWCRHLLLLPHTWLALLQLPELRVRQSCSKHPQTMTYQRFVSLGIECCLEFLETCTLRLLMSSRCWYAIGYMAVAATGRNMRRLCLFFAKPTTFYSFLYKVINMLIVLGSLEQPVECHPMLLHCICKISLVVSQSLLSTGLELPASRLKRVCHIVSPQMCWCSAAQPGPVESISDKLQAIPNSTRSPIVSVAASTVPDDAAATQPEQKEERINCVLPADCCWDPSYHVYLEHSNTVDHVLLTNLRATAQNYRLLAA